MKRFFYNGAILLGLSSLLSRLLGVFRANRLAAIFGTTEASNAYFTAFTLPDLIYALLVYGAVSAAFVPIFTSLQETKRESDPWDFTSNVLIVLLSSTTLACIFIWLFTPQITDLLYSGLPPSTKSLTADLLRILILSPLIFTVSAICGGVQTALGKFSAYALAPILYNLSIIIGIVYFQDIYAVAWATVCGAALHAFIQFIAVYKFGFRFSFEISRQWINIRHFFWLALPRIFAITTTHINLVVDASIATLVPFGSLAILRYAQDINSFPMGIIGLSVATASFGTLSSLIAQNDHLKFAYLIQKKLLRILYFIIPATIGLHLTRHEIVSLILHGGVFNSTDLTQTAHTLSFLAMGLIGTATIPLLARAFYAQQQTSYPLYAALAGVFVNLVLDLLLYQTYGIYGLAIGSSAAALIQMCLLLLWLTRQINWRLILEPLKTLEIIFSSAAMSLVIHLVSSQTIIPNTTTEIGLRAILLILLGAATYLGFSYALGTMHSIFTEKDA